MDVARLVGIEVRDYIGRDGLQKRYTGLHLCYPEGMCDAVKGSKVESVSCPKGVVAGHLEIGKLYQMKYQLFDTKNGKGARLVDLLPVEE